MITLYQPPGAWGTSSISPYCIKLETWLRMMEIPYRVARANPPRAPKGKVPYIRDEDGSIMGDSQLILEHLQRRHGDHLDAWLDPTQRATGRAVRRMIEEGTYWVGVQNRWLRDEGYAEVKKAFAAFLPAPLLPIAMPIIRRRVRASAIGQGTARHSDEEIEAMGRADWAAVAEILGDKPYLLGDRPCSVDATVYGFLESVTRFPVQSTVATYIGSRANLIGLRDRIAARYWPPLPAKT